MALKKYLFENDLDIYVCICFVFLFFFWGGEGSALYVCMQRINPQVCLVRVLMILFPS